jgi:hypothetical protein
VDQGEHVCRVASGWIEGYLSAFGVQSIVSAEIQSATSVIFSVQLVK